jgi:hypothetical protein
MALFLTDCGQVLISDRSFTPFDQIKTVYFDTSWLSTVGGCGEHPCATGHSCTYAQYSRNCTACPASTFSPSLQSESQPHLERDLELEPEPEPEPESKPEPEQPYY